jgi:hypothetical protein
VEGTGWHSPKSVLFLIFQILKNDLQNGTKNMLVLQSSWGLQQSISFHGISVFDGFATVQQHKSVTDFFPLLFWPAKSLKPTTR